MPAHHDFHVDEPDRFRCHDLIGRPHLQQAVHMYAGLMSKSICAHNRFVRLDTNPREVGNKLARPVNLLRVDSGLVVEKIFSYIDRHHDFLERGVSRPFTEAVHRHFDLTGSILYRHE